MRPSQSLEKEKIHYKTGKRGKGKNDITCASRRRLYRVFRRPKGTKATAVSSGRKNIVNLQERKKVALAAA